MKKIAFTFFVVVFFTGITYSQYDIPDKLPKQTSLYDYAGLLTGSGARFLEEKLIRYSDSTSTQIVIIIIESTNGDDVHELATKWGNKWGVGEIGKDNGIVLLMAKNDRTLAIATGEGIENKLIDTDAKKVIDVRIVPEFKKGNYYKGLDHGLDGIFEFLEGEFKGVIKQEKSRGIIAHEVGNTFVDKLFRNLPTILFSIIVIIAIIFGKKGRFTANGGRDDDNDWPYHLDYDDFGSSGDSDDFDDSDGGSFGGGGASGSW